MTIIKKFEPAQENKTVSKKIIGIIVLCFLVLILVQIWVSNTVVSYGEKLDKLSALEKSLKTENQLLENQMAQETSLSTVATKSAELGFSKVESIQYIR